MKTARSVLIAGAGDVGGRLARLLADRGHEVLALRRSDSPAVPGVRALRADLNTGDGFHRLPRQPDALVFCAAPDERTEAAYARLYVDGMRRLLDVLETPRLLFVSSTAVYSEDAGEWVDEQTPATATVFNGRVLLIAESELAPHPGACVLRLTGLYGPGREWLLRQALDAEPLMRRRWSNRVHVDDAAAAMAGLLAAERPARLYLGSDDLPALECDVVAWLREQQGLPAAAAGRELAESGRRVRNALLRATGWQPRYPDYQAGYASLLPPIS